MSKCRYCKMCGWGNDGDEDFFGWCKLNLDSYDVGEDRECPNYMKATNADRIRGMSDEELAWELMMWRCEAVARHHGIESEYPDTQQEILKWLQQPAEEGA